MSIRTRAVPAPGRVARRVQAAERVKSGAAQRAYTRRRTRAELGAGELTGPTLPRGRRSAMASRIPFVAAIIALLGCGLALTLLLTTRAAEDSYQLGDARSLNSRLSEERAALQRQVEAADSAPELAARARELGMIPATDPARLLVGPDGTVTVVGDPTPAQGAPVPPLNITPRPVPGHTQAQGERVVPVSLVPQPTTPTVGLPTALPGPTGVVPVPAAPEANATGPQAGAPAPVDAEVPLPQDGSAPGAVPVESPAPLAGTAGVPGPEGGIR